MEKENDQKLKFTNLTIKKKSKEIVINSQKLMVPTRDNR
ncbi:hypothetical protein HWC99_gp34 [Flavobacterium phage vB_FspS_tant8-1]|uniref:Uncharacterized protein n=1 Tax=Flavobacterium phage vB_FspS_tant8-1 TaxID=2686278 RepID=A0A6B9LRT4_9CAUD|nr:hypothetical protein HWC99_gp34 [Flavobacterium phage vB_FspS_tant8-1]QHB40965.1 hypothetical protein tant81_gp034 [Flavobacterium phage vB_FspS_tant8-1]